MDKHERNVAIPLDDCCEPANIKPNDVAIRPRRRHRAVRDDPIESRLLPMFPPWKEPVSHRVWHPRSDPMNSSRNSLKDCQTGIQSLIAGVNGVKYGRGVYFAVNAPYACKFAKHTSSIVRS